MGLIGILLILLFFYLIFRMMWLAYMIEHLRAGGSVEQFPKRQVWGKILGLGRRFNNYMWMGPYISEFHDTDEIKEWIGKRNRVVGVFLALAVLILLVQIFFHPFPTKTSTH